LKIFQASGLVAGSRSPFVTSSDFPTNARPHGEWNLRVRDPVDLIAGRVEDRDLVRAEQAHVEVARLGEREAVACGGAWFGSNGKRWTSETTICPPRIDRSGAMRAAVQAAAATAATANSGSYAV
jgi:hypothetical protein